LSYLDFSSHFLRTGCPAWAKSRTFEANLAFSEGNTSETAGISQSLPAQSRPDKGFSRHLFAPFASPAVDKTTNFWSESNAGSHHGAEAKLLMKPTVAGAGLGMSPERLSVNVDVAVH